MAPIRRFLARLAALVRRDRHERDLTRELAAHLALLEDDFQQRGLTAAQAQAAARRALGGIDQTKERHRDQRSFPWLDDIRRDVPYAIRGLSRQPAFTLAALLTTALGVGAATAIFSVINTIVLRPLPYRDSDRLVQIAENLVAESADGPIYSRRFGLVQAEFLEWRARTTTLAQMAGVINLMSGSLQTADGSVAAPRAIVSPVLFEMLGVPAQLGRTLVAADEYPDAEAAVISAAAWQRFFGGDPNALGQRVTLNDRPFTIVGVMPPGFDYPERSTMFWTTLAARPGIGANAFGNVVAKLKASVDVPAAVDEANVIGAALRTARPPTIGYGAVGAPPVTTSATLGGQLRMPLDLAGRPRFEVVVLKDLIVDLIRPQMRVLAAAVAVLLLIVCANVANLLLARGTARQREIGVRLAIGAGRGRIVRQIITESTVLSVAGGALGIGVAVAAVSLVRTLATVDTPRLFQLSINLGDGSLLPRMGEFGVDGSLMIAAVTIALLAGVSCSLAPAFYISGTNAAHAIKAGGVRSDGAQPSGGRLRDALVVMQVGMATTLLIGAGLLVHSFLKLHTADPGYDARDVLTFQLAFPQQTPGERQLSVIERVIARLEADSRVASAGYTNIAPFLQVTEYGGLFAPPNSSRQAMLDDPLRPQTRIVSHGYLQTLGSRLLDGRWLDEGDSGSQPLVFVVNKALVQRYFGGRRPVGTMVRVFRSEDQVEHWQIVGVVDDVKQARLDQEAFPLVFADMRQFVAARARLPKNLQTGAALPGFPTIAVHTHAGWQPVAADLRSTVRDVDPAVSVTTVVDLESLRFGSLVRPRFYATLVGLFAAIAATLAAIGIYGVLAYAVAQRRHEFGVRMALGARQGQLLMTVLRHGMLLTLIGVGAGLVCAAGLMRYLSTMLYGLTPLDVRTYVVVSVAFVAVAALACYVPARRATGVDPLIALRAE